MKKKTKNQAPEQIPPDSDEHFAYIAGYTEGGAPYGVTWEEMEADKRSAATPRSGIPPERQQRGQDSKGVSP